MDQHMKKYVIFLLSCFIGAAANGQGLTAKEIIQKADDKNRGLSSQGEMTMTIIRPDWSRSVSMKSWSKGKECSMVLITDPAKDKGQVFLKLKNDMWNWMPAIDKLIKIPPSMMLQSWMGSDFTNDDLVRESSIVIDYTHKLLGEETIRGQDCYKIELTPLPDAPVVWGKVIMWITAAGYDQWKAEYYDEDNHLINVSNSYDIKKMSDREVPTKIEIIPQNKTGQKTVLQINRIQFNIKMDDSFFSQQNMRKVK